MPVGGPQLLRDKHGSGLSLKLNEAAHQPIPGNIEASGPEQFAKGIRVSSCRRADREAVSVRHGAVVSTARWRRSARKGAGSRVVGAVVMLGQAAVS